MPLLPIQFFRERRTGQFGGVWKLSQRAVQTIPLLPRRAFA